MRYIYFMSFCIALLFLSASSASAEESSMMIQNKELLVQFSETRPWIVSSIALSGSGRIINFMQNEGFVLKTLTPEQYAAQAMNFRRVGGDQYSVAGVEKSQDGRQVVYNLSGRQFNLRLTYTVPEHGTYVRQQATITNNAEQPVVITAVQPVAVTLPREMYRMVEAEPYGFPTYFQGMDCGLIISVDFPGAHTLRDRDRFRTEYRPMKRLEPGESYDAFPSALIAVPTIDPHDARTTFHGYLADVVNRKSDYPVPFCTWGPWMIQANEPIARKHIPLLPEAGSDIYLVDDGWLDFEAVKRLFAEGPVTPETAHTVLDLKRYPGGPEELKRLCDAAGVGLGFHFDVGRSGSVAKLPYSDLTYLSDRDTMTQYFNVASPAGEHMKELILYWVKQCDLAAVKLDFFWIHTNGGEGYTHYANGYDEVDQQMLMMVDTAKAVRALKPEIYLSLASGGGFYSPYWAYWVDQMHTRDPLLPPQLEKLLTTTPIYRVLSCARRGAWYDRYWALWTPPYIIKMDIAARAYQQRTTAETHPNDSPWIISEAIDWEQTLFSAIACGRIRDFRADLLLMSPQERAVMKQWFSWAEQQGALMDHSRPLTMPLGGMEPDMFLQLDGKRGLLYILPGLKESPEWVNVSLGKEEGIAPDIEQIAYKVIHPYKGALVAVKRGKDGSFSFRLPGPCQSPALIAELDLSGSSPAGRKDSEGAEYAKYAAGMKAVYPAGIELDIDALGKAFRANKPIVVPFGESTDFHKHRDEQLLFAAANYASVLAGDTVETTNASTAELTKAKNIVLVGHTEQERFLKGAGIPEVENQFGITSLRFSDGSRWASGIAKTEKGVTSILGRTPDETALALGKLEEQIAQRCSTIQKDILPREILPEQEVSGTITVPAATQGVAFLRFAPEVRALNKDWQMTGPVELKVFVETENGRRELFNQRIVPQMRPMNDPPPLPLTRYICLREFAGRQVKLMITATPLEDRSRTAVSLGNPEMALFESR